MNDSSAIYLIFSLLKVQIENLSLNNDDRECRKNIKTLERTECKTLFNNCISSTVGLYISTDDIYIWNYCIKALESRWNSILAILFSNNQTLNHHLLKPFQIQTLKNQKGYIWGLIPYKFLHVVRISLFLVRPNLFNLFYSVLPIDSRGILPFQWL